MDEEQSLAEQDLPAKDTADCGCIISVVAAMPLAALGPLVPSVLGLAGLVLLIVALVRRRALALQVSVALAQPFCRGSVTDSPRHTADERTHRTWQRLFRTCASAALIRFK